MAWCSVKAQGQLYFYLYWGPWRLSQDSAGLECLDDRGYGVRFPAVAGNFSLHHRVHNVSGAHPASYPMGTRGCFSEDEAAEAWSWPLISI
jgi:hypothetical protein